jgi:hypothetical protein
MTGIGFIIAFVNPAAASASLWAAGELRLDYRLAAGEVVRYLAFGADVPSAG